MRIGVMQPYFLPYIGYWQLLNFVDTYVIFDDVNFINRGWINRNRILINGKPKYINIPLSGASQNKLINEIYILNDNYQKENLKKVELSYAKAPYFENAYSVFRKINDNKEKKLSKYLYDSLILICEYLEIETNIVFSSEIHKNNLLKAQEKILEICKILGASEYTNAIGGQNLYSKNKFKEKNIRLEFLKTEEIIYSQFNNEFQPDLSIIDVMMFNSKQEIKSMLNKFKII